MLIVKCQQNRGRQITDVNGTKEYKSNALCLHILGRIADINGEEMRQEIGRALTMSVEPKNMKAAVDGVMRIFKENLKASYWCPSCHAFMDVTFSDPGYETEAAFSKDVDYGRVMNPKIKSRIVEL